MNMQRGILILGSDWYVSPFSAIIMIMKPFDPYDFQHKSFNFPEKLSHQPAWLKKMMSYKK